MEDTDCYSFSTFLKKMNYAVESQLREIASSCLLALDSLHSKGIVHGVIVWNES